MTIAQTVKELVVGKPEAAPKGSLQEAEQKVVEFGDKIEELKNRPPSTDYNENRQRSLDLDALQQTKKAWQGVSAGIIQQQVDQDLAAARIKAKEAAAASASAPAKAADRLLAAWEAYEELEAIAENERQATSELTGLESPTGARERSSRLGHILAGPSQAPYRDGLAGLLVDLGIGEKGL